MSDVGQKMGGLVFRVGERYFRVWKNGYEYGNNLCGRVVFFWWHPISRQNRKLKKELKGFYKKLETTPLKNSENV